MNGNIFSLQGRVALITGASRGLGWSMAQALAVAGAHVILNGRDEERLQDRAQLLSDAGLVATAQPFDVTDQAAAVAAVAEIVEREGRLDVLVANAGIQHRAPLTEFSTEDFIRVLDTDLVATFVLAREAAKAMAAQGAGRIIFVASIIGQVARPMEPAYSAASGGLLGLVRALAVELGPKGITCNAIAPGYFATEMNATLLADPEFCAWLDSRVPLRRWGRSEELGGAVVFLASPAGAYVNGHVLVIDGGMAVNA